MVSRRRLLVLLGVCALIGIPAGVLRATCAGRSCDEGRVVQARVPFCPLPDPVKTLVADGYYEGRSPDVLGVGAVPVAGGTEPGEGSAPWPAADTLDPTVPLAFFGTGVNTSATLPGDMRLDRVAPTLAEILGFRRAHPEVRSGTAVEGLANGDRPRLVVELVWTGGGTPEYRADPSIAPTLRTLLRSGDAVASERIPVGSVPLDPAATLTTIGTGGLPAQHGITGSLIRDDAGEVVAPWSPGAPTSVIATLPDDLAFADPATKVGTVLPDRADRGIVGGTWYDDPRPRMDVTLDPRHPARDVEAMLATGYGADGTPDVLAVVVAGPLRAFDAALAAIIPAVREAVPETTYVVTATGAPAPVDALPASDVVAHVDASVRSSGPIVAAAVPGGLFLDQDVLTADGLSSDAAVQPMLGMRVADGGKVFADAFPGFAVSFARYC